MVLARLTPAERTELAQRAAELGVGGDPSLFLIIGIVLLVAILLYLPMAGRMQGWWYRAPAPPPAAREAALTACAVRHRVGRKPPGP